MFLDSLICDSGYLVLFGQQAVKIQDIKYRKIMFLDSLDATPLVTCISHAKEVAALIEDAARGFQLERRFCRSSQTA
jgi:hypothetical protein